MGDLRFSFLCFMKGLWCYIDTEMTLLTYNDIYIYMCVYIYIYKFILAMNGIALLKLHYTISENKCKVGKVVMMV